jgi:hypothetical protein
MAHPGFKTGKRSRYLKSLPPALKKGHKLASEDEEITSLRDELALVTARIEQLLEQLGEGESPSWETARAAWDDFRAARPEDKQAKLAALGRIICAGAGAARNQDETWAQIRRWIRVRVRCSAAEHRRLMDLECFVPAADALMLFRALLETTRQVIRDRLKDPRQASELFREVCRGVQHLLPAPTIPDNDG